VSDDLNNHHSTPPPAQVTDQSEPVDGLTPGATTLATALQELVAILPSLRDALDRRARPPVERLAYRREELAAAIGVSRITIDRERAAGRLPKPDLWVGTGARKTPLWRVETVRAWIERGGRQ
jgi:hypothetical protein